MKYCLMTILILLTTTVHGTEERFQLETVQQKQWFIELGKELRCPKCQNQNIADSNATVSLDMKRKVHQLLLKGQNKDQILGYMKQRYGDFVHYSPPVNSGTLMLWILPLLMLTSGVLIIVGKGLKQKNSANTEELLQADSILDEGLGEGQGDK